MARAGRSRQLVFGGKRQYPGDVSQNIPDVRDFVATRIARGSLRADDNSRARVELVNL